MQSFLQFRSFRRAAQAQLERDKARLQQPDLQHDTEASNSPSSHASEDSKVDLEKGDDAVAADLAGGVTQSGEPVEEKDEEEPEEDDDDDFELGQYRTNLSRTTTQQSAGTALGTVLSGIEVRKRTTREGGDGRVFVVGYENENDPNDPHNWSNARRMACTVPIAFIGAVVGFASAVDSPAIPQAAKEFGVSDVVRTFTCGESRSIETRGCAVVSHIDGAIFLVAPSLQP